MVTPLYLHLILLKINKLIMKATLLNVTEWKRKNHFNFYKNFVDPYFNICCQLDVSNAVTFAKSNKISVFFTLLYLSAKVCNQISAFKLRLTMAQDVEQYQLVQPAATLLNIDDTFTFCNFDFENDLFTFVNKAEIARENALKIESLSNIENRPEHIFYSIVPWLNFTGYKHASNGSGIGHPKIVFGKITQNAQQKYMPVSVELHHALADGIDIAKYIQLFQEEINHLIQN